MQNGAAVRRAEREGNSVEVHVDAVGRLVPQFTGQAVVDGETVGYGAVLAVECCLRNAFVAVLEVSTNSSFRACCCGQAAVLDFLASFSLEARSAVTSGNKKGMSSFLS